MSDSERQPCALVTGASSGIGAGLATRLARDGWAVWLAARRRDRLEEVAAAIREAGGVAHTVVLDVSDADRTAAEVVRIDETCGGLDLVVASAGTHGTARPKRITWEIARAALSTNLVGAAAALVPLVPRMIERRRGHLVGISSIASELPVPIMASYGSSKAGLSHLLQALRPELRRHEVWATDVRPGFVNTDFVAGATFPLPGLVAPGRAIEIIYRGIRKRRPVVRFPWHVGLGVRLFGAMPRLFRDWTIRRLRL